MVRLPKNIRQIGTCGGNVKIYVEDYVETWLRQYAEDALTSCAAAVFVGQYLREDRERNVFIYGAVKADCVLDGKIQFNESVWTGIYEDIKKYFPDGEIVGWFLGGPSFLLEADTVRKVHADHFAGADKVLMKYDALEREEAFYLTESGCLNKQEGYYIYYDRNEGMQNYMVDHKRVEKSIEADFTDNTTKKIKSAVMENKARAEREKAEGKEGRTGKGAKPSSLSAQNPEQSALGGGRPEDGKRGDEKQGNAVKPVKLHRPENPIKGMKGLMYAAGTLAAAVMLIIGASMLNKYEKIKQEPDSISVIGGQKNTGSTQAGTAETKKEAGSEPSEHTAGQGSLQAESSEPAESGITEGKATEPEGGITTEAGSTVGTSQAQVPEESSATEPKSEAKSEPESQPEAQTEPASGSDGAGGESAQKPDKDEGGEDTTKDGQENTTGTDSKETSGKPEDLKYYTVEKGDTLLGIALRLYHSADYIQKIKDLNDLKDENLIYIGQTLMIP